MKPCSHNRKFIALLAVDALDAQETRDLRTHLETCPGCRQYLAEISRVTQNLSAVESDTTIHTSPAFHQSVVKQLQSTDSASPWKKLVAYLAPRLSWRLALPATIALVVLAVLTWVPRQEPPVVFHPSPTHETASSFRFPRNPAPTLANYQMVANQSLDQLDKLLTRQGNKSLPPTPLYTASSLKLANGSF